VIGIELDQDVVAAGLAITTGETADDLVGLIIEHARAHVDRFVIVRNANFRAEGRRRALIRPELVELRDDRHVLPDGFIEAAVQLDLAGQTNRRRLGRQGHVVGAVRRRRRDHARRNRRGRLHGRRLLLRLGECRRGGQRQQQSAANQGFM
jgi:hypothetical protein